MDRSDVLNEDINKSLFDYYDKLGELKCPLACNWCLDDSNVIYAIEGETICGPCLSNTTVGEYFED